MCYQNKTVEVCDRCSSRSTLVTYGPVTPCGRRGRGPLTQIDDTNTEEPCYGVEVYEEESSVDLCHNCRILEELKARERERQRDNNTEDEEWEDVYIR
jgi:hypothetical protein